MTTYKSPKIRSFDEGEIEQFKNVFINENRGKPIVLLRFQDIKSLSFLDFLQLVPIKISELYPGAENHYSYYCYRDKKSLLIGVAPLQVNGSGSNGFLNFDSLLGKLREISIKSGSVNFDFGIARTQCNYISYVDEIFHELEVSSLKNLQDNLIRWSWTYLNRVNDYFAGEKADAVIQPIIHYNYKTQSYSMKGGEVFVGGEAYAGYADLIRDIPHDQDLNRIELLILEKLTMCCNGAPGLLKFNISPQTLIDTFDTDEKVTRFHNLLLDQNLNPFLVRMELIEKPYEEKDVTLKSVCKRFWNFGISFAADDFGVKSQSHQIVLDLGEMIKEFKLDPISFKFKADQDLTKFLDNLAFIDYCRRLSDNREAIITAEALEDIDSLNFLLTHQVYYFQANLFCKKISIGEYKEIFKDMQDLPEAAVNRILTSEKLLLQLKEKGNIFELAKKLELVP
ncbi:diguanylate phosphodiesterase [Leptospira noguchii]|uniref:diguanylate phosphodiesterase n=1 Tax=Leptospira noguchii TaxID=28182 RepID=UPI001FB651AE|nr:diguanylate phosphodiesterase [Leptospira noguchii]UOG32402.1 diguanylate phosphodiesterase [Leptospira noguchii]UOG35988.1 diguanylate phosphodiesterase [Leptospira noguchii]UOG46934.1 diguanylate phosphodiesterase [Leptospira noguchii]